MKKHALKISFALSTVSLLVTLIINYNIAAEYVRCSGKTKALFGIKELYQFGYQYYVVLAGLAALLFAIAGKTSRRPVKIATILYALLATGVVFVRVWRIFV